MKLREIIEYVDGVMPNAFAPEEKTLWLNDLEYAIQTDILNRTEEITDHVWESSWRGPGVRVTDGTTLTIPGRLEARAGGEVLIEGLGKNDGDGLTVLAAEVSDEETVLTFEAGTFDEDGAGEASIMYDGGGEEMLLPAQWQSLYHAWLRCRICENSREYSQYGNELQTYNNIMGRFQRWYARTYIDPEE